MTTTPYDAVIARLEAIPEAYRSRTFSDALHLGYIERRGYLARAAEEDAVKQALLAAAKRARRRFSDHNGVVGESVGNGNYPAVDALEAAIALAEKETP